jgi:peroxiredoxin
MRTLTIFTFVLILSISAYSQAVTKTVTKTIVQGPAVATVGSPVPDFSVTSIDGKTFDTQAMRGKVVVLNLWFVNCPFCVQEIAILNPIVTQFPDAVFIGMAVNTKPQLDAFLKTNPFKYNIIPNAGQLMLFKFGDVDSKGNFDLKFPQHIVIDRTGNVVLQMQGIKGVDAVRQELQKQFGK